MSDMRKLLESMNKFAGEPEQRPGDQVRGTEPATKKKSGKHPFQGRLVGGESIFRELEKQLIEGDVERRLREEFEQFTEEQDVVEANDPNFVGFMNKALGDRVDNKPEQPKTGQDWYDNAPTMSMDNMPSYKHAFKFGMSVLQSMDAETKQHFAEADNDKLFSYLMKLARKKGLDPKYFVEEDMFEVTGLFSEIFHDPAMVDWEWSDLLRSTLKDQGVDESLFGFVANPETKPKDEPVDPYAAKLLARRQQQQARAPKEKIYRGPEEYRKEKEHVNELGANNPPQQNSAVTGTATTSGAAAPVNPKDAAALKQSLMKLKTSVPGLDVTKAVTTMAKADTGTQLNPADQKIASAIAPQLANVMKNPQMATSLKMMIDKADQQEKAAAAKPPGTV